MEANLDANQELPNLVPCLFHEVFLRPTLMPSQGLRSPNRSHGSPAASSPVRYAKFESIRYFIDIDILQNHHIDINIFQNHLINIDIDIDIFGIA